MKINYRKIWESVNGSIPTDSNGRTYEIHHIDGNRENNSIENLLCVSIDEHYKIHYENGDYGACVMIAKRMNLPPDYISNIQKGTSRKGVGGDKKGNIPWNKNLTGYALTIPEESKMRKKDAVKNRAVIKDGDASDIRQDFENKVPIDNPNIGKVMKNGRVFGYERAFCLHYALKYNVTDQYIYRIIKGKSKIV